MFVGLHFERLQPSVQCGGLYCVGVPIEGGCSGEQGKSDLSLVARAFRELHSVPESTVVRTLQSMKRGRFIGLDTTEQESL
jgi:hypothetical protein